MKSDSNHPKIFGIGLNKTGTTTLGDCGRILGYRATGCHRSLLVDVVRHNDFSGVEKVIASYDLFEDWPWPVIYRELDKRYPGSKFILTTRSSPEVWLRSLKKHALRTPPFKHCRKLAYGYSFPHGKEQAHIDQYLRHNAEVRDYFAGREGDFLEICWENGDGWEKLCPFLGKEIPDVPVPHSNRGANERVSRGVQALNTVLSRL
ncbi:MAG TPA: hypothetical protein ENK26_14995 [Gammaproteobacteria bacterium]|nr:hypothetical protein [Gammaproteobacteria bacterium]